MHTTKRKPSTDGDERPKTRRVNPDHLAERLGPDLVRDMEVHIYPGAQMPSFAVRKELQERYAIDRRHIYDYFHAKGLRVAQKERFNNLARWRNKADQKPWNPSDESLSTSEAPSSIIASPGATDMASPVKKRKVIEFESTEVEKSPRKLRPRRQPLSPTSNAARVVRPVRVNFKSKGLKQLSLPSQASSPIQASSSLAPSPISYRTSTSSPTIPTEQQPFLSDTSVHTSPNASSSSSSFAVTPDPLDALFGLEQSHYHDSEPEHLLSLFSQVTDNTSLHYSYEFMDSSTCNAYTPAAYLY